MANLVGFAIGLTQARQADVPREDAARFGLLGAAAPNPLMGAVLVNAALGQRPRYVAGRSGFRLPRQAGAFTIPRDAGGGGGDTAEERRIRELQRELERQLQRLEEQLAEQEEQERARREQERERQLEQRHVEEAAVADILESFRHYERAVAAREEGEPPEDVEEARRDLTEALIRLQSLVGADRGGDGDDGGGDKSGA